jgi:hypothetical protein
VGYTLFDGGDGERTSVVKVSSCQVGQRAEAALERSFGGTKTIEQMSECQHCTVSSNRERQEPNSKKEFIVIVMKK